MEIPFHEQFTLRQALQATLLLRNYHIIPSLQNHFSFPISNHPKPHTPVIPEHLDSASNIPPNAAGRRLWDLAPAVGLSKRARLWRHVAPASAATRDDIDPAPPTAAVSAVPGATGQVWGSLCSTTKVQETRQALVLYGPSSPSSSAVQPAALFCHPILSSNSVVQFCRTVMSPNSVVKLCCPILSSNFDDRWYR